MNRSVLLDLLRIIAISLVVVAHVGQLLGHASGDFFGIKNLYFVSLGGVGVSIFLLLSGILAGLSRSSHQESYLVYLLKRARRIYPLYWLSLPLCILGYALGNGLFKGDLPELFPNGFITDLLGSLTGFYAWAGLWGGPYNPPSWYITLIMNLYALCPLLLWCMQRWPHQTLAALFCISLGARYYVGQWGVPFVEPTLLGQVEGWFYRQYGFMPGRPGDWFPPCRLFEFGLGLYLALRLPATIWLRLNILSTSVIRRLSDLAFPLFLVHYPFLFLIPELAELGLPIWIGLMTYMALMLFAAAAISQLEHPLSRVVDQHLSARKL
ncbi:acyltransferase [Marinobacterium maritimum]|uniref:Acyltransferase n=1 Tax=Marinobacterium maritimum TaxID=500162 RepID=A0ABN1I2Z1_9GAMM